MGGKGGALLPSSFFLMFRMDSKIFFDLSRRHLFTSFFMMVVTSMMLVIIDNTGRKEKTAAHYKGH
ncbi:hypothetical protein [Echinicola jeungdonensis]